MTDGYGMYAERWSCEMPKQNIKLMSKVIQCMERLGEDINLDVSPDSFIFKSVNKSRSAYSQFVFHPSFFGSYLPPQNLTCYLVKAKPLSAVFKSVNSMEHVRIRMNEIDCRFIFDLQCAYGVRKSYKLTYEDSDTIDCHFQKDAPNKLKAKPKFLSDIFANFHNNTEEVCMLFSGNRYTLKTYVDVAQMQPDGPNLTRTELSVDPKDFDLYSITHEGEEIVIPLKEAKAICNFAEALNQPITISFGRPGEPLVMSVKFFHFLEVDIVIATLGSDEDSSQLSQATQATNPLSQNSQSQTQTQSPSQTQTMDVKMVPVGDSIPPPHTPSNSKSMSVGADVRMSSPPSSPSNTLSASLKRPRPDSPTPSTPSGSLATSQRKRPLFVGLSREDASGTDSGTDSE